jgi:hypothetical protein
LLLAQARGGLAQLPQARAHLVRQLRSRDHAEDARGTRHRRARLAGGFEGIHDARDALDAVPGLHADRAQRQGALDAR